MYKNGIFGHRYKGFYIIRGEDGEPFKICRDDGSVFADDIPDFEECEWAIDKHAASSEDMEIMKKLYEMPLCDLSGMLIELIRKKEENGGLDKEDKAMYAWCEKIRARKADERPF